LWGEKEGRKEITRVYKGKRHPGMVKSKGPIKKKGLGVAKKLISEKMGVGKKQGNIGKNINKRGERKKGGGGSGKGGEEKCLLRGN